MICPDCYAEYFTNVELCGDCNKPLVEASLLDMPIPEMKWIALPYFEGKVYSDMITEIFDEKGIPYYRKANWTSSAYGIQGINTAGDFIKIYVPKKSYEEALMITKSIIGNK